MATLPSGLTTHDLDVMIEALNLWRTHESGNSYRHGTAILIQAKLVLQKKKKEKDSMDREPHANEDVVPTIAEQFIRECGIWIYFKEYVTDQKSA